MDFSRTTPIFFFLLCSLLIVVYVQRIRLLVFKADKIAASLNVLSVASVLYLAGRELAAYAAAALMN
jgi:hypothetical protein